MWPVVSKVQPRTLGSIDCGPHGKTDIRVTRAYGSSCSPQQTGSRERRKTENRKHTSCDILPPARLHLLRFPEPSKVVPPAGDPALIAGAWRGVGCASDLNHNISRCLRGWNLHGTKGPEARSDSIKTSVYSASGLAGICLERKGGMGMGRKKGRRQKTSRG